MSAFTIRAWPIDNPAYPRFWRSMVTCPHGLDWWVEGNFDSEIEALRAARAYRKEVEELICSDAACNAYHERANALSATAKVIIAPGETP